MKDKSDIGPFSEMTAQLRMASDCRQRTLDQCPLGGADEVNWDYVLKQLELELKYIGLAYTSARQTRDQRRADREQKVRLGKARQALNQAELKTGVNRG